jgi:hypothetical protein
MESGSDEEALQAWGFNSKWTPDVCSDLCPDRRH